MASVSSKPERLPIRSSEDIVMVRQAVRARAVELGLSLVDQTKVVTAASELARNTLIHGGGGWAQVEVAENLGRRGVRLVFEDEGPGIPDIEKALQDGFTTGTGLGLGLGGSKRLSSEFHIVSKVGEGTRITLIRWKI
jgi:serine/threonine-protein kinase RsbT